MFIPKPLSCVLLYGLFILIGCYSPIVMAQSNSTETNSSSQTAATAEQAKTVTNDDLDALQQQLNDIKQQVSAVPNDNQLLTLNNQASDIANKADDFTAILQPDLTQIQAQLDVVGATPVPNNVGESAEVTQKRTSLNAEKSAIEKKLSYAQTIKTSATNLSKQLTELRRNALKTQLALNTGSLLTPRFWSPFFNPRPEDLDKLTEFWQQLNAVWTATWQPATFWGSLILMLVGVMIWGFGSYFFEKTLVWLSTRAFPDGRLRRSFLACAMVIASVITAWCGTNLVYWAFARQQELPQQVSSFADALFNLILFSAAIAGIGRALLSNARPSWRLIPIPDPLAKALRFHPLLLALLLLFFSAIEQMNSTISSSVASTIFCSGIVSLLIAILFGSATLIANRVRNALKTEGKAPEARSSMMGMIHLSVSFVCLMILIVLLIGYVSLARFLAYELVWFSLVLACLFLTTQFVSDLAESLFSENSASGKWIKQVFHLDSRYLAQATVLFSALGKTVLILLAIVALFNGNYGSTTPSTIASKTVEILGRDSVGQINIVPANVFNALICLAVGMYVLRTVRNWLDCQFLPKTAMDSGMRTSIVTLFTNIGYALLILLVLSVLGIEWNKLAWIVSALSVGIGFGLQEIVKNFISGLILLTERPIKVGDLVSISGIEGDIQRINVRATEIQLNDKSTVIVPNSQLISQNVRNVTMDNAQGVVTIDLKFPLDINPEQVKNILIDVFTQHDSVYDKPAPTVTFSQLAPDGITLSVTGYVSSPRVIIRTKSDLLFNILKRLREVGVKLSA